MPDPTRIYSLLRDHFGPQHWWPAETPFEVVVGAILTQNTAWQNVVRAIANLKEAGLLTPARLAAAPQPLLETLIRPAGCFRQKAARLQSIAALLHTRHAGDIDALCAGPLSQVRQRLLSIKGIGPETADAILLYACGRPSFVIDAYTHRIFRRLGLFRGTESYAQAQHFFHSSLPPDPQLFNEYHALLVALGKTCCLKSRPACVPCPLLEICCDATVRTAADEKPPGRGDG